MLLPYSANAGPDGALPPLLLLLGGVSSVTEY